MFERYKIKVVENEEILFLYMNHDYEFGIFDTVKDRSKNLMGEINQYIQDHKINFHGQKIALVANGILISSLLVSSMGPREQNIHAIPTSNALTLSEVVLMNRKEPIKEEILEEEQNSEELVLDDSILEQEKKPISNLPAINQSFSNSGSISENQKPSTLLPSIEENKNPYETGIGKMVTVIRSNGTIIELALEDYMIGVVAGEMPASFSVEALKSQALASRTYVLKRMTQNQVISDTMKDQVYVDIDQMKKQWGSQFDYYYNRIKQAVLNTAGKAIYYQGNLIDAVYFSTTNGKTEDAEYVWGTAFPYLVSVDSSWDIGTREYFKTIKRNLSEISMILGIPVTSDTIIRVLERNRSGRVITVQIDDFILNGIDLYNQLGLRSRDFDMWIEDGSLYVVTRGWGHGVGMSQYGAEGMAKEGYTYEQIVKHYYPGVSIY